MSANRSSAGERSHRALIPHANFRKRAPLVPSPFRGPPLVPRSSASFASCSSTTVITRYIAFRTNRYPPAMGNAPIEASAGKISKFPSECINRPRQRAIAKEYNILRRTEGGEYFKRATDCVYLPPLLGPLKRQFIFLLFPNYTELMSVSAVQEKVALNTCERDAREKNCTNRAKFLEGDL